MDIRQKQKLFRENLFSYGCGFLILFGMKYFYSTADCEGLRWILGPTARWVETLCGIPFVYEPGMGYANHGLRFLIAPSCSGFQFMLITAAMLIFSFSHRIGGSGNTDSFDTARLAGEAGSLVSAAGARGKDPVGSVLGPNGRCPLPTIPRLRRTTIRLGWIAASLLLSYALTVFVNGLRIVVAIYLPSFLKRFGALGGLLAPDKLHTMIGVVVYFAALLVIYRLAALFFYRKDDAEKDRLLARTVRRCLSPVFWYFFIVLGIPFLNRAYGKSNGKFTEFALLVTLCCGLVLFLYFLGDLIRRGLGGRK